MPRFTGMNFRQRGWASGRNKTRSTRPTTKASSMDGNVDAFDFLSGSQIVQNQQKDTPIVSQDNPCEGTSADTTDINSIVTPDVRRRPDSTTKKHNSQKEKKRKRPVTFFPFDEDEAYSLAERRDESKPNVPKDEPSNIRKRTTRNGNVAAKVEEVTYSPPEGPVIEDDSSCKRRDPSAQNHDGTLRTRKRARTTQNKVKSVLESLPNPSDSSVREIPPNAKESRADPEQQPSRTAKLDSLASLSSQECLKDEQRQRPAGDCEIAGTSRRVRVVTREMYSKRKSLNESRVKTITDAKALVHEGQSDIILVHDGLLSKKFPSPSNCWHASLSVSPEIDAVECPGLHKLAWEACLLRKSREAVTSQFWIDSFGSRINNASLHVPKPLGIFRARPGKARQRIAGRYGVTGNDAESEDNVEVLGSLMDLMNIHCKYNLGPIPEAEVAWLVLQTIGVVTILHSCGVTHNDLGLDSFVLLRRRKGGETDDVDGSNFTWFLQCTGLGERGALLQIGPDNERAPPISREYDKSRLRSHQHWHYEHDIFSLANIACLLLTGGAPLAWETTEDGVNRLQSISFERERSQYLLGSVAWNDLFNALLNPPSRDHGLHSHGMKGCSEREIAECASKATQSIAWSELACATTLLSTVANRGRPSAPFEESPSVFLDGLMHQVRYERAKGKPGPIGLRWCTKLLVPTPHCEGDDCSCKSYGLLGGAYNDKLKCDSMQMPSIPSKKKAEVDVEKRVAELNKTHEADMGQLRKEMEERLKAKDKEWEAKFEQQKRDSRESAEVHTQSLNDAQELLDVERQKHNDAMQELYRKYNDLVSRNKILHTSVQHHAQQAQSMNDNAAILAVNLRKAHLQLEKMRKELQQREVFHQQRHGALMQQARNYALL